MSEKIRWGILSTGHISGRFVEALKLIPEAEISAVASRNEKTAKEKVVGVDGVIVGSAFDNVLLQEDLTLSQKIEKCCSIARVIKQKINE